MFTFDSIPFFGCLTLDFLILFLVYETVYEIKHHLIDFACKRTLSRYFLAVQGGSLAIERTCCELREILKADFELDRGKQSIPASDHHVITQSRHDHCYGHTRFQCRIVQTGTIRNRSVQRVLYLIQSAIFKEEKV